VSQETWVKLFGHYINILLCDQVVRFLVWFKLSTSIDFDLASQRIQDVCDSLHLGRAQTLRELASNLNSARLRFEAIINNIGDGQRPPLSMQGAPLDALFEAICELPPLKNKLFFFLVDEYENFEDYQQQILNTLIKHSGQWYTFKIGVKELGWRVRSTLNVNEQLISPADYVRISIAERFSGDTFKEFARSVCNSRLASLKMHGQTAIGDIADSLPALSEEEEAGKLGVNGALKEFQEDLRKTPDGALAIQELSPLQQYFLKSWGDTQNMTYSQVIVDFQSKRREWDDRFGNYKYAILFSIKRGKRGIRKYYSGWSLFSQLAAGNIRYLIELVEQSLLLHVREGISLKRPVSPETQTLAAQAVGRKNVSELEGLSVHGAQLTKLVLGLGRIFQVMAAQPLGHAPEVSQFHISEEEDSIALSVCDLPDDVDQLIKSAVMHLALIRFPANKLADEGATRDYDYTIHPVFSAFFEFSHRRKRKMVISAADLMGLVREPQTFIPRILSKQNRSADEDLPEQASLFQGYYGRHS
jgi:hypothetical protein